MTSVSLKGFHKPELFPVFPRQTGASDNGRRRERCGRRGAPSTGAAGSDCLGEFGKLRERLPACHSFAPPQIRRRETTGAQTGANIFLGKNAQAGGATINIDHRHNAGVLVNPFRESQSFPRQFA